MKIPNEVKLMLVSSVIGVITQNFSQEIKELSMKLDMVFLFYSLCYLVATVLLVSLFIKKYWTKERQKNKLIVKVGYRNNDDLVIEKILKQQISINEL